MRRWVWRALLLAAVVTALTGSALAEEVRYPASGANSIRYDLTNGVGTVLGPANKSTIKKAEIPSAVNGVAITKIAANAFEGCTSLDTVEIGGNIATIGESAFINCTALKHLNFSKDSKVSGIERDAFSGCSQLNNVILPPGLTIIRAGTFSRCAQLDTIYIPAHVQTIEATAFYMDAKLLILHYGNSQTKPAQGDTTERIVHFSLLSPAQEIEKATCTVDGKERVTASCEECNKDIITEEHAIPATGHTPGDEVLEVPATCVATGMEKGRYCTVCNQPAEGLGVLPVDPENHAGPVVPIPEAESTCTEKGSTGGMSCSSCGAVTEEPTELEMQPHDMQAVTDAEWDITKPATCTEKGSQTRVSKKCSNCEETETETEEIDPLGHTYALMEDSHVIKNDCINGHITVKDWACSVCGDEKEYWEYCPDGETHTADNEIDEAYLEHLVKSHGGNQEAAAGRHTPGEDVEYEDEKLPTCTEEGERVYENGYVCVVCGEDLTGGERREPIDALGHDWTETRDIVLKEPTCEETGKTRVGGRTCQREDCPLKTDEGPYMDPNTGTDREDPPKGHKWGAPTVSGEETEERKPCEEGKTTGTASCEVCGKVSENVEVILPPAAEHAWSKWTPSKDGSKETRTCSVCGRTEERAVSATPPEKPDTPDEPDKPDDPGTKPPADADYTITVVQGAGGTISVSRTSAKAGTSVSVTVTPNAGYELDMIRIIGDTTAQDLTGSRRSFTMPASNVKVQASFTQAASGAGWGGVSSSSSRSDPPRSRNNGTVQSTPMSVPQISAWEQIFQDIPTNYWAAGEINWANQMGYMNGANGRFDPDAPITAQQMWMVLARLNGTNPANMAEARRWAVLGGFADGSAPEGSVSRHQLVTALYRCAHLIGSGNKNRVSLAGYADSRLVATVARDAFSWALANGIVTADASKRLNPNSTVTRAEFAVILYRFSQRA